MALLPPIETTTVVHCGLAEVERAILSCAVWALWPGVRTVHHEATHRFAVRQQLELPFFGVTDQVFHITIDAIHHSDRGVDVDWHTEGWQFSRRGAWHARLLRTRTRLTLACHDEVDDIRLEHARNAYRATSIWPMRHGHNEVLTLLTLDFLRDKLIADDQAFVNGVRKCLQHRDTEAAALCQAAASHRSA
jgi:hypothetical protein